jgi:uracil phosphoribosyltransferase
MKTQVIRTRMADAHAEGSFSAPLVDREISAVSVNLARAGTLPSHICYSELNELLDPNRVRQDHISISRTTDQRSHQVTGAALSGHKIGGKVDGAFVFIPDPMGATGGTLSEVIALYKKHFGVARKYIAIHCIVTPEYLKRVTHDHPDLEVYAFRLDRGLSPAEILKTIPGTHWEQERGLNASQYIVPGGGGLGEVLNNAFV